LGTNSTGLVEPDLSVVGGENPWHGGVIPMGDAIYQIDVTDGKTLSTVVWPSATIAGWNSFLDLASRTPTILSGVPTGTGRKTGAGTSRFRARRRNWLFRIGMISSLFLLDNICH
jgi:hypothetical protein